MNERRDHILKPVKEFTLQNLMYNIFLDSETYINEIESEGIKKVLFDFRMACIDLVVLTEENDRLRDELFERVSFTNTIDLHEYILETYKICENSDEDLNIWIHNQHFDFFACRFFDMIRKNNFDVAKHIVDPSIFFLKIKLPNFKHYIIFRDSFGYFRTSIEKMGKVLDLPKLNVDFNKDDDESIKVYCFRDVEILRKTVIEFIKFIYKHDLGRLGLTIASQAFNAFRHRFMRHKIVIHTRKTIIQAERESYYGGRTECFALGKFEDVIQLDVNSLYPSVMKDNYFPVCFIKKVLHPSVNSLKKYLKDFCVIAKVLVDIPKLRFGIVPKRIKGKLVFPCGQFYGVYCGPELEFLLERNWIKQIDYLILYERGKIFKDYVSFFYKRRVDFKRNNNPLYNWICKLFLNSLYGKFGQREKEIELENEREGFKVGYTKEVYVDKDKNIEVRNVYHLGNNRIVTKKVNHNAYNSFVAIASYVTSYARVKMLQYLFLVDGQNLYMDTDCICIKKSVYEKKKDKLPISEKLGDLKIENEGNMVIRGLKDYIFEKPNEKIEKIKGVNLKIAKKINDHTFEQLKFMKAKSLLKEGIYNRVEGRMMQIKLNRYYNKGVVLKDGRIRPFWIYENGKLDYTDIEKNSRLFHEIIEYRRLQGVVSNFTYK